MNGDGVLKICDFGLARVVEGSAALAPSGRLGSDNGGGRNAMSNQVATRNFRAPELLYGARLYGAEVDMWSVGCILAQLLLRAPLLSADLESDFGMLKAITQILGSPSAEAQAEYRDFPESFRIVESAGCGLRAKFPSDDEPTLALLGALLEYQPSRRISAAEALRHPYFAAEPLPKEGAQLLRPEPRADKEARLRREEEERDQAREQLSALRGQRAARLQLGDGSETAMDAAAGGGAGGGASSADGAEGGAGAGDAALLDSLLGADPDAESPYGARKRRLDFDF